MHRYDPCGQEAFLSSTRLPYWMEMMLKKNKKKKSQNYKI